MASDVSRFDRYGANRLNDLAKLTPDDESSESHIEAKMTTQVRWIKKNLGLGTVFTFITAVAATVLLIVQLASPAVKQGEINGATTKAIDNLAAAQKENKEESKLALNDAVARIEASVNKGLELGQKAVELAQQNRDEMNRMRDSMERRIIDVGAKADALWDGQSTMKSRIFKLETLQELRDREAKEKR